jgi:hypothetical protein
MSRRPFRIVIALVLGMFVAGPVACGGDDSSDGGGQSAPQTVSKEVSAATGGTVEGPGVQLDIPPGALSQDTTISVVVQGKAGVPSSDTVASSVFEMGPDGLQFAQPVTLQIDFDASNPPADAKAQIAVLEGSTWKALGDSTVSGSTVTATTTHFSTFAVVWTSSGQTGGMCAEDFTACGGDVVGKWAFSAACATLAPGSDPFNGQCPTATMTLTVDMSGTVEFVADGTYSVNNTVNASMKADIPKSCLPPGATCEAMADGKPVTDTGSSCVLTETQPEETNAESGTYTASGSTLTLTDEGGTPEAAEYCVTGNTAQVKITDEDGQIVMYTLDKQ